MTTAIDSKAEARTLIALAAPMMVAQGGQMLMGVVDTAVMGRVSALEMAAVALGTSVVGVSTVVGIGVVLAVEPLLGQAHGAGQADRIRHWLWQSVWLVGLLALPLCLVTWGLSLGLESFGIAPELAERTRPYVLTRLPGLAFVCLASGQRVFFSNIGRPRPALWAAVFANILNLGLDLALVLGWAGLPALGAIGCGLATTGCHIFITIFHGVAIRRLLDAGGRRPPLPSGPDIARLFRLGVPIGLQFGVEVGAFSVVSALVGRLGAVPLAAHQVALSLASFAFLSVIGVSNASTARVGFHVGRGSDASARTSGLLGIVIGAAFMGMTGLIFMVFSEPIAVAFSKETQVQTLGAQLVMIAGAFAIADGVQVVASGALRGLGRTKVSFWTNLVAHWGISLPVGLYLSESYGAQGFWWALTLGLGVVAVVLGTYFAVVSKRPAPRLDRETDAESS